MTLADLIDEAVSDPPPSMITSRELPAPQRRTRWDTPRQLRSRHNDSTLGLGFPMMSLWSVTTAATLAETPVFTTAVGLPCRALLVGGTNRIEPGSHTASAVWYRMSERGNNNQMPPVGTEFVDADGLALISAWIDAIM